MKVVSEEALLKENLLAILEGLNIGIIAHDMERRIIYFNRAAEELTGYERSEVLGKDCHLVFKEPFCGSKCHFEEGIPQRLPERPYEVSIKTKQGLLRRVLMNVTSLSKNGNPFGVLASFEDISAKLETIDTDLKGINFHGIVTRDPTMLQIIGRIKEIAALDYPVYIHGETGTGKELVANAIHEESRRSGRPFVTVNCAAIPETLLESELFGYEKGAFTGALRTKKGRFELADKGTIFLDEIGELNRFMQAKLLRVVETLQITRLGAESAMQLDVRILVATNRDLKEEVKRGRFREDLFYRLAGLSIQLPPLRKRPGDIPLLVKYFLGKMRAEGLKEREVSKETMEILQSYPWPGNVRELQSALRYASIHSDGLVITPSHLPPEITASPKGRGLEKDRILKAIKKAGGNRSKAARYLGISRATLYRYLKGMGSVS